MFIAEVSYTVTTFNNPMYNEEMRVADFLDEPHIAVVKALLLQFQPTFLDILPLYILMLAIFPFDPARAAAAAGAGADPVFRALRGGADLRRSRCRPTRKGMSGTSTRSPGSSSSSRAPRSAYRAWQGGADCRRAGSGPRWPSRRWRQSARSIDQAQLDDPRRVGPVSRGCSCRSCGRSTRTTCRRCGSSPFFAAGRVGRRAGAAAGALSAHGRLARWFCAASNRWRCSASASCCRRSAISSFGIRIRSRRCSSPLILSALSRCSLYCQDDRLV